MTMVERVTLFRATTEASMRNCSSGKLEKSGTAFSTAVETVVAIAGTIPRELAGYLSRSDRHEALGLRYLQSGAPMSSESPIALRKRAARVSSFVAKMM